MSSPAKEEIKGGHAPAVKVGGMRVVQHPHTHTEKLSREELEKEEEEFQTEKPEEKPVVVAGVVTKGDKDYSPAATKVAHEKPIPSKEKPTQKGPKGTPNIHLKQPSKH
ncbi:death-associated protein 1-like [Hydractinia symbiolongicarpus]|uniref:death-associated protein 1-like n=1 Tax=Hydractinia symbiolongicarpus TaxID=13093 RepID=UPI00254C179B|nr:death-associated protein 1-like [Hydractinia symbiolongicarpus]